MNPEQLKKAGKGAAVVGGTLGATALAILLNGFATDIRVLQEQIAKTREVVASLRTKVTGEVAAVAHLPMNPPAPVPTPGPHPSATWADLLPFPVPHGEKRK